MFPKSTHGTFAQKLYQTFRNNKRFAKPKLSSTDFTIYHYAGEVRTNFVKIPTLQLSDGRLLNFLLLHLQVIYQANHFLDKNKDYVVAEHQDLLHDSKCPFVANLFPSLPEVSSKASKFSSIASRFKVILLSFFHLL